jgi:succinate dehydrogenase / fumarate reductase flavoprotein subunit
MAEFETHSYDVLVIGAGGAGLRAAIEASAAGVSVGLVCKSLLGKAHTVMAEGGIAAALANVDDRDNWRVHFADTMRGGQYINNWRMAELHAKESPDRVREQEAWGAVFDRTKDGRMLQRNFGGHRYPRLAHVGDRTGLEIIRTLQDHGVHQGIQVHMECTIIRLLKDGEHIAGAFGYYRESGHFVVFQARAVVLAMGGLGRAYLITSNSWEGTGDGHALGYDAGAELIDMEFIQFHPTGMVWPLAYGASWSQKEFAARAACCEIKTASDSCWPTFRNFTKLRRPTMKMKVGATRKVIGTLVDPPNCSLVTTWPAALSAR